MSIRVIKLGGSLLDWPELRRRLHRWLDAEPPATNVLIVGGGLIVDGLRAIDGAQQLSSVGSHWLAIQAMSLTSRILSELLPEAVFVDSLSVIRNSLDGALMVLDVEPVLRAEQGGGGSLAEGWHISSDSIAAHIARRLEAAELVLLKSADPPHRSSAKQLAASGYVDAYFPSIADGLRFRCVNLRG